MVIGWLSLFLIYIISFTIANPTNYTIEPRHIPVRFFTPIIAPSLASRCFGCQVPSYDCTVPCSSPQRCFIRGPTPFYPVTDRRCTDERWVRDLLVDGCLTYNGLYWCMCSTDLCNSGDFSSIRGFDDCSNTPCPSGTICLDTKDGFSCICPPWQEDCTYSFSVGCTCKNGGRCMMGLGTYVCECPYGYNGVNCEIRLKTPPLTDRIRRQIYSSSSFLPAPCLARCERRTCTYRQSGFGLAPLSCTCNEPLHYSSVSRNCNTQPAPKPYVVCNPNPCRYGQSCHSLTSYSFYCTCQVAYVGALCERPNPCAHNPCSVSQRCVVNSQQKAICVCNTPYCQRRDICIPNPCMNGGTCQLQGLLSFTCQCRTGFHGLTCQICDACVPNPCQNGGSCIFDESSGSFRCYCPPGYTGRTCDVGGAIVPSSPNPCSSNPCRNGGTCQSNNAGSFTCVCPIGYQGVCCEIRSDPCRPSPCQNNGICMASGASFSCSCQSGFFGQNCEMRDPCAQSPCLNGGQCFPNNIGGLTCQCPLGFSGQRCEDRTDPCASQPCRNGGTCQPVNSNSYQCICPSGFSGFDCSTRDPCSQNPCMNGGQCFPNNIGGFTCQCPLGFSGQRCEDHDPCASQPCMNQGTCMRENGGFRCVCLPGYSGSLCEILDPCQSNPCMNDGACQPTNGNVGYHCTCPTGFSGLQCETRDVCSPNPCFNGATCIPNGIGGFICECPPNFTGQRCEDQDGCANQPCKNRGVCVSSSNGLYECQCRTGFEGPTCEQMDVCGVKNPCICGTCQNDPYSPQGFRCFCPPGYSGDRCEKILNCLDAGEECLNGGTCIQRPLGDYVCSCSYPYCGLRCQSQRPSCGMTNTLPPITTPSTNTNACSSNLCNNHGICREAAYGKGIQCYCSTGWSGSRCQYSLSCNDTRQCSNGGVCREITEDISICHCPAQFWGERCEYAYESWSGTNLHEHQQQYNSDQYNDTDPSTASVIKKNVSNKTKKRKQANKI